MRPTVAEIDLRAIGHNLNAIKERVAPAKIMAVVKANAYGHGIDAVARVAAANGASYLGVALLEEGVELRRHDFTLPILVFGGFFARQVDEFLRYDLDSTVFDLAQTTALSNRARQIGKSARVHIKIDSGMGRVGVLWPQAAEFVKRVAELDGIEIVGLYTHFSSSDEQTTNYSEIQLDRFCRILDDLESCNLEIPLKHAANSGAVLTFPKSYLDLVRIGLSMYGYAPTSNLKDELAISPAMTVKSEVIAVKEVEANTDISYNRTYTTKAHTDIATIPIGYGDGYNRLLSNSGEVLIRGKRQRLVGRVCMDQIMVNVGADSGVRVGDEVVLLGRQGDEEITIYEICEKLRTIPYEVTCLLTERVPRVYKR
ncbi:alanine racemase [bacterium]|nr:alanine racemase [bacterium]